MPASKFTSVEEFLAAQAPAQQKTLRAIIDFILAEFPELECKLAWNVPQIHRGDKYVFGFNAFKDHLALAPWSTAVLGQFKERLAGYVVKVNTFMVPVDWEVERDLIGDMVRARLAELD
jgi:uncharacterized protein YdhG (YjbR/CyaY superfamily)